MKLIIPGRPARAAVTAFGALALLSLAGCEYSPDRTELEAKIAEAEAGEFGTCIDESYQAGVELQVARDRLKELQEGSPSDTDLAEGLAAAERAKALRQRAQEVCVREQRELADAEAVAMMEEQLRVLTQRLSAMESRQSSMSQEILIGVTFDTDSDKLTSAAQGVLDVQADRLVRRAVTVEVAGFASSSGTPQHNLDLSQRRADRVRDYLVTRGVDSSLISSKGYGIENPIASNETEGGRRANQRIELHYMQ